MTPAQLREAARALVKRSTAAQGLPEHITDPAVLGRVAAIIGRDTNPPSGVASGPTKEESA